MPPAVQVGTILIEEQPLIAKVLGLESEPFSGNWGVVKAFDSSALERNIHSAGWNFFFIAAEVKVMFVLLENLEVSERTGIILLSQFSPPMLISPTTLLATLASLFRSRAALEFENLALRQQIGVLQGATGSAALRAEAAQSALCAYLSLIALAGLAMNAIWHVKWADPMAALAILPLMVWEGWQAMRGKACACC